ncbi:plasma alpha-L-fucosidase [Pyricularia oryzae 70-15]|uniref:alpha-L-fucosidase n=3 Tax=Pyricularia oryzae TaxID=318829 RepID=G4N9U6_PYRO7|nr:plasma alpha-L-fucosidase [Pyricularia oryzae 70-15]EHA50398.1 plasma alpha-L-fucosidase [Pyricularia oryzae 70-15]ELQ34531.1 plasma alpha-L-fucosidase [Pyricularia oryzae Y34]KAI7931367.1 plasma alpha-L-fucosidase [Pyricularia oryzae]KAI7931663.1 plasma alpha-L-fucosidase [Pyricularia oryzae]
MRVSFSTAASFLLHSAVFAQTYQPTWPSTDQHNASPEWFRDAKFGVYWHWGAFTVPQFGSEWYGRNVYLPDTSERRHHTTTYGAPPEVWGYENFITGRNDAQGNFVQFKPVIASDGGSFDPEAWMAVIKASGAKFAGPVGEHHDGFSMWKSEVNEWNSVALGPKIDLLKLFAGLVRGNGLKLVVALHQAFNHNGFFEDAPQQTDPSLQKLFGQLPKNVSDQLWFDKAREVIDHVQPDMIWNDFSLDSPGYCQNPKFPCNIEESQRLKYLAYYFNAGERWGKEVVTSYKHFDQGFRTTSAVADWERGGPAELERPYWLTDDAISATSWSYTEGISYYNSTQMIHSMLDRVSKNGNMLLNVSPTAAGVMPAEQQQVLRDIGTYLARYGESIYSTRAWDIYGEGPTKAGGGSFTGPMMGNSNDLRFTRNKDGNVLYVSVLGWPSSGQVPIKALGSDRLVDVSGLRSVQLMGDNAGDFIDVTAFSQAADALVITLPQQPAQSPAYVLKLTFAGKIPVVQQALGASVFASPDATGAGVSLAKGNFTQMWVADAGLKLSDVRFLRVSEGASVTLYAEDNQTGASTKLGAGDHQLEAGSVGSLAVGDA